MSGTRRWRFAATLHRRPIPTLAGVTLTLALALALLPLAGCSDTSAPGGGDSVDPGGQDFSGELDPGGGTFLLQKADLPGSGRHGAVQLIGSDLTVDQGEETVAITVALRNASDRPLQGPATVWIFCLRPADVSVLNPDLVRHATPPPDGSWAASDDDPGPPVAWGFRYDGLFGDDGILEPGEVSAGKPWRFHVPGLTSFAFAARIEFGLEPRLPLLGGRVWQDLDADGLPGRGEPPLPVGMVEVLPPEGHAIVTRVDELGRWALPVRLPGLYRATWLPPPTPTEVRFTTPNPLEVLLTSAGPGEPPRGFLHADFGVLLDRPPPPPPPPPGAPPIVLTRMPPDSLHLASFSLESYEVIGHVLRLTVGFSGCQPRHPFTLFMSGGFAESEPVQATLVLRHDDLGEPCDAWFSRDLEFDLTPMIRLYLHQYGAPGVILVRLLGPDGVVATFRFTIERRPM